MSTVTLGGDRLGSGKKQKVDLKNYERSSHDLSYIWRSTMASGTLVPFMSEVGLPGDSFDIDLDVDIKTHPTIGPLFGSYKVQLDVFSCPVRLYNGKLHMNMLNIGLDMAQIKLPQIQMEAKNLRNDVRKDNEQINPSSIYSYLNIRGLGVNTDNEPFNIVRYFNAIPYLAYWDIYKQYYANKQEEIGAVIHNPQNAEPNTIRSFEIINGTNTWYIPEAPITTNNMVEYNYGTTAVIVFDNQYEVQPNEIFVFIDGTIKTLDQIFTNCVWNYVNKTMNCSGSIPQGIYVTIAFELTMNQDINDAIPRIETFPLDNIDQMRKNILADVNNPSPYLITAATLAPYGLGLEQGDTEKWSKQSTQEGLGLKTYQSDLFNNWVSTEWIDGPNGINEITKVDTQSGGFTLDTLQLSRKVYDMLNRIAVSGGSYDDWLDAVYTHERTRSIENPMYMGGLIKELGFQEVISNATALGEGVEQPLGTLAGRGVLTKKTKGGKITIRVDEPSYIMGIISLTPRIDYSQGNKWDVNLKTMDDFHKPGLDEIGFQDLVTDQMAWWDTEIVAGEPAYKSAGKQPAWINYMTNVNVVRGNFAEETEQMFMTLNRRYEANENGIKDLTTYIDPSKFNHIFADTRLDAQNFWAQIGVNIYARRKMSAKLMPNL